MKHASNERGAVPVLVIVLVVVLVAAAGVAVYNVTKTHNKDTQTASVSVSASPSPANSPASTASPVPTPTPSPMNVFIVKELGIQFTTSDTRDFVYVTRTNNGVTSAYFSTASLIAADKNAGGKYCTPEADAPLGSISLSASAGSGERVIKTIGSQSLVYATPQSACSQNTSVMSLASKQVQAFQHALSTAEAIH